MPKTIELPDELAVALTGEASRLGLSLPDYAVRLLTSAPRIAPGCQTGADLVAYWQSEGVLGTRPEISDSSAYARQLREQAQRRGM